MAELVTELESAYPTATAPAASGSGAANTTRIPLGSKKGDFWGKEAAPMQRISEADAEIGDAVKEQGENQISRAVGEAEGATLAKDTAQQSVDRLQALSDLHKVEYTKELEKLRPIMEAADKFQFHQYWSDPHTGRAITAALSSALLGFGTGQYHNIAMEIADKDHARQVEELNGLLERAKMAGASADQLRQVQHDSTMAMHAMEVAKNNAIAKQIEEMAKQSALPEAETSAKMGSAIAKRKAAEAYRKILTEASTHASSNVSRTLKQPTARLIGE